MSVSVARSPLRTAILIGSAVLLVLGASGLLEAEAFTLPTSLKYGLTVGGPLVILLAAMMEQPLRLITALTIVAAPFVGGTAQLAGVRVSLLVPLLLGGAALVAASEPQQGRPPVLRWAAWLAFPLMYIPIEIGSNGHQFVVSLALMLAVGAMVARTASDDDGMTTVIVAVAVQAGIQGAIGIWEARTGHRLNLYSGPGTSQYAANYLFKYGTSLRPTGAFTDPIALGNVLALSIPLTMVLIVRARDRTARLTFIAMFAVAGIALGLALSRESWIGATAGLIVAILLLPQPTRRRVIPVAAVSAAAVVTIALILAGPAVTGRFNSIFNPTNTQGVNADQKGAAAGDQSRLQFWEVALNDGFASHPGAGVGIDNMGQLIREHTTSAGAAVRAGTAQYANAASTYFQLLGDAGLFAVVLLVLLLTGLFHDLRRALQRTPIFGAALVGGVVAILICWLTDVVVFSEPVAACVGVLFGAVAGAGRSEPSAGASVAG